MQVYLIRHTTPNIAKGICYGQTDVELNKTVFKQELKIIQSKLPNGIEQFYSSPLQRCAILSKKLSDNLIFDERLKEINFGDWENKYWNAIDQNELNQWMQDFVNVKTHKGESYIDLHRRSLSFIDEILNLNHKKIAVITHAGNIRSLLSFVLSLPLENSFKINLNYGAVVSITLDKLGKNHQLNLGY